MAGEGSNAAHKRLSDKKNYTSSFMCKTDTSAPLAAEVTDINAFQSHREFLENVKIRRWLTVDKNPEEQANFTSTALLRQTLRSTI